MATEGIRIVGLEVENVKRISAVAFQPDGDVIVIGGQNGQGKSSLLDSIEWALGGKPDAPMPIRKGESKARIVLDLGDIRVERVFTMGEEDGKVRSYLKVGNAEGMNYTSPQAVLDRLIGTIAFDPLEFTRKKPKEQVEILRQAMGLDFSEIDADRRNAYDERTNVHREQKRLEATFAEAEAYEDVPDEEVSIGELTAALTEANRKNQDREDAVRELAREQDETGRLIEYRKGTLDEIKRLEDQIEALRQKVTGFDEQIAGRQAQHKEAESALAGMLPVDTQPLQDAIENAEDINRKVRMNKALAAGKAVWQEHEKTRVELNKIIETCDATKQKLLAETQMPVEGLAFQIDEDGNVADSLYLNEIPFEQASSAEQLKASFGIVAAQNPKLRVCIIRDGSLLDQSSLAYLEKIAAAHGMQVWVERVSDGAEVSVLIEDGHIKPVLQAVAGGGA